MGCDWAPWMPMGLCPPWGCVETCSHCPRWPRVSEQTDRANVPVHHHVPSSMMPATLQVLDKYGFNKLHAYWAPLGAQVHGDFFAAWGSPAHECSSIVWLRWNMKALTKPWPLKTQPGCSLSPAWPVPSGLLAPSGMFPASKTFFQPQHQHRSKKSFFTSLLWSRGTCLCFLSNLSL